jgi:hypothetical protein
MIVGAHARTGDLNVNVCKNKKLTNVRSAGADDALNLTPVRKMTLEDARPAPLPPPIVTRTGLPLPEGLGTVEPP